MSQEEIKTFDLPQWKDNDTENHLGIGWLIYHPSKRWRDAGIQAGDFIFSSSLTGSLNSVEKMDIAAKSDHVEIFLERMVEGKLTRFKVTL